jgi:hypothetical protein
LLIAVENLWENLMHHLKETVIDGVKFVLIPEELHDKLVEYIASDIDDGYSETREIEELWTDYDPEIFDGL